MGRRWNRFKAAVYTRFSWINGMYVRWAGARWTDRIPLPALAPPPPLSEATVALLTSGGVHLLGQEPFDMRNPEGDASVRFIPGDTDLGDLVITHDYYDHSAADLDPNCVFPLDRLREMADAGVIAGVAPRHVAFMGHLLGGELARLARRTAHEIAAALRDDRVDVVLASPG